MKLYLGRGNKPYQNESVDEILTTHLIQYTELQHEESFWPEANRVLKYGRK